MTDQNFPEINYEPTASARQWGQQHGESFRTGIAQLADIRTNLLREKNSSLTLDHIRQLGEQQWEITNSFDSAIAQELQGIAEGSGLELWQIVVLNNYTDFRDIELPEHGCSTVFLRRGDGTALAGQTWDTHRSAKLYMCCLRVPGGGDGSPASDMSAAHADATPPSSRPSMVLLSVVGCVGIAGVNDRALFVGINNLNTKGGRPGLIWSALVRKILQQHELVQASRMLTQAQVGSGRAWLLAQSRQAQCWEVLPDARQLVGSVGETDASSQSDSGSNDCVLQGGGYESLVHTNHCLAPETAPWDKPILPRSTTQDRLRLLRRKIDQVGNLPGLIRLLQDHDEYPRSICSNVDDGHPDPAVTCGGIAFDLLQGDLHLWRGDQQYDANYQERTESVAISRVPPHQLCHLE